MANISISNVNGNDGLLSGGMRVVAVVGVIATKELSVRFYFYYVWCWRT